MVAAGDGDRERDRAKLVELLDGRGSDPDRALSARHSIERCDPAGDRHARVDPELVEDVRDVALDGPLRDEKLRRDRRVRGAVSDKAGDLHLPTRQASGLLGDGRAPRGSWRLGESKRVADELTATHRLSGAKRGIVAALAESFARRGR